jgi:hypothetical protein
MNNTFLKQLWLVIRIWLLAVAVNTLLGTFYLTDFFAKSHEIGLFLEIGTFYGALFSFPIMMVLLIIINRCMATDTNGMLLFMIFFASGIVCTVIMFLIFWAMIGGYGNMAILICIAVLSGIIAMASFHTSLLKSGSDFKNANIKTIDL